MKFKTVVLVIGLFSLLSRSATAQNEEILARLKEFKIDEERLSSNIKEEDAVHAYTLTSLTGSKDGNVESIAKYDPLQKVGKRWTLLTVNGAAPEKGDIKQFNKLHNPKNKNISGKIDPTSYEIERDDKKFLIVKFRYIKESLPSKFRFLGDCDARVYCKKDIMEISYAEFGYSIGHYLFIELVTRICCQNTRTFCIDHENMAWNPATLNVGFDCVIS